MRVARVVTAARGLLALLLGSGLVAAPVAAQPASAGWAPHTAHRLPALTKRATVTIPGSSARSPGVSAAPEEVPELVLPILLVGVAFSDTPDTDIATMRASMDAWAGGGTAGDWRNWNQPQSVIRYWAEVSRVVTGETRWPVPRESFRSKFGVLPFTLPDTVAAVRLPRSRAYYTGGYSSNRFAGIGDRTQDFLWDAATELDSAYRLNQLPRGDSLASLVAGVGAPFPAGLEPILPDEGGEIPLVVFVQASRPGECRARGPAGLVSHGRSIEEMTGRVYRSTRLDSLVEGTIRRQGPVLNQYLVVSGVGCDGRPVGPARLNHEIGHLLGLPDLSRPAATATGERQSVVGAWDLMDQGHLALTPEGVGTPLGAWSRQQLGWSVPTTVTTDTSTARRLLTSNSLSSGRHLEILAGDGRTRWLIEERRKVNLDAVLPFPTGRDMGWLVWQIDETAITSTALALNRLNAGAPEAPAIRLLQADGGVGRQAGEVPEGTGGDLWSSTAPGDTLRLALTTWDGVRKGDLLIARRRDVSELQAAWYQPLVSDDTTGDGGIVPPARWGEIQLLTGGVRSDSFPAFAGTGESRRATRVAGRVASPLDLEVGFADAAVGRRATVELSVDGVALGLGFDSTTTTTVAATSSSGPRWQIRLSPSADSATGTRRIPLAAQRSTMRLTARLTVDGVTAVRTWPVVIDLLEDPKLGLTAVGQAAAGGAALPERVVKFYDAHGNNNNRLDPLDVLSALRQGILTPVGAAAAGAATRVPSSPSGR